jgi:hypothetical protein
MLASGKVRLGVSAFLLLAGCGSPPGEIRKKLREIGQSDLEVILGELSEKARREALLPQPFFVVDEYQEFHGDTAIVFQAYAALAFFYLDPGLDLCQIRKYRYRRSARLWERYEVVLRHFPPRYPGGAVPDSIRVKQSEKP